MKRIAIISLALAWQYCSADVMETETTTTTTTTTVENGYVEEAQVSKVYPDGISIVTWDGVRRLKWSQLPSEIRTKYAAAAAVAEEEELERMRARIAALEQEISHLRYNRTAYYAPPGIIYK